VAVERSSSQVDSPGLSPFFPPLRALEWVGGRGRKGKEKKKKLANSTQSQGVIRRQPPRPILIRIAQGAFAEVKRTHEGGEKEEKEKRPQRPRSAVQSALVRS